jgi:hypothetical protein
VAGAEARLDRARSLLELAEGSADGKAKIDVEDAAVIMEVAVKLFVSVTFMMTSFRLPTVVYYTSSQD